EYVFGGFGEANVGRAHAAPATVDGKEYVGHVGDEGGLLLGVEHEVTVAEFDGSESCEDAAANSEVYGSHVGAFLGACQAQSDAAKVLCIHEDSSSESRIRAAKAGV